MALSNEFILSELIKSGSSALKQQVTDTGIILMDTNVDTDGPTFGYVERPIYNNNQLVKAVDTVVDELIGPPPQESPEVVLFSIYDDLRDLYNQALNDIQVLQEQVDGLIVENDLLRTNIQQLEVDLDLQKLLKASADNERDSLQVSLQQVSLDLQASLTKGTKEAIERVSREASLQGALADKESFVKIQEQTIEAINTANKTIDTLQVELSRAQSDYARAISNFLSSK